MYLQGQASNPDPLPAANTLTEIADLVEHSVDLGHHIGPIQLNHLLPVHVTLVFSR